MAATLQGTADPNMNLDDAMKSEECLRQALLGGQVLPTGANVANLEVFRT